MKDTKMKDRYVRIGWSSCVSALLLMSVGNTAHADTNEAGQAVSVSVPKTLLVDIEDTAITILFTAPTEAGASFTTSTTTPVDPIAVAITSNVENAKLYAKTATADGDSLSDFNLKLSLIGTGAIFPTLVALSDTDVVIGDISDYISGDFTTTRDKLMVVGDMVDANQIMPYGSYDAVITYTLKEN
jgi:hypothetical protein